MINRIKDIEKISNQKFNDNFETLLYKLWYLRTLIITNKILVDYIQRKREYIEKLKKEVYTKKQYRKLKNEHI